MKEYVAFYTRDKDEKNPERWDVVLFNAKDDAEAQLEANGEIPKLGRLIGVEELTDGESKLWTEFMKGKRIAPNPEGDWAQLLMKLDKKKARRMVH